MIYKQQPPFAVQVELCEGCNLYCDFCGLQGIRGPKDKTFKFMTMQTAKRIADEIAREKWNPRIEFAMHGEPTMNPDYIKIVKAFRRRLPKHHIMMTSNGGGLLRPPGVVESLVQLFDAGLNVFAFDAYEYVKIKDKVDEALSLEKQHDGFEASFDIHRYPDEKEFSPHNRYGHTARKFIRVQDISVAEKGTHSSLNNHTGCGSKPLKKPIVARCAKPFREMSFRWDGSVAICCNDWRGEFKIGNIRDYDIEDIWNNVRMDAARRFLMQGDRASVFPCSVCDAKSYRVGLLPDKLGKDTMPKPTPRSLELVQKATTGKSYTEHVLTPWELLRRTKK